MGLRQRLNAIYVETSTPKITKTRPYAGVGHAFETLTSGVRSVGYRRKNSWRQDITLCRF